MCFIEYVGFVDMLKVVIIVLAENTAAVPLCVLKVQRD